MRLAYLIYSINILGDSQHLAFFESTKRSRSWLSHQAVGGQEANMCVYGKNDEPLWCCEGLVGEKDERQYSLGMYCVLGPFWGRLPIYFLKSSRKTIFLILSYLIYL